MISIDRIQFHVLLQLTWCRRLKSIIPKMRKPGGKTCGLWTPFLNTKTALSHEETFQLTELSSDNGLESTFDSVIGNFENKKWISKFTWNSNEIYLCFPTTYLCDTAFFAMTVIRRNQNRLQLSISVWLSLQFIQQLPSQRKENSNKNLTSLIKTFKHSAVIKATKF
jgi:hypothetical protein